MGELLDNLVHFYYMKGVSSNIEQYIILVQPYTFCKSVLLLLYG